ncbi:MAG: tRNA(Ile)-lysidine synthase [Flavobacteriaceae bacterium]|jgi:tRNA(Ile)-lysidine synthase|uniref:tRNA lysidine(34) synthetase TilS n=1 Tax=Candidatus Marifrigoribacter sp. Uisw_064 TaxID=3230970 RepID=UPI003ADE1607
MLHEFNKHIIKDFPFLEGKKLLIACSGGLDSVVLSRLMKELNYNISLAHCNFSLRGLESDEDETFVNQLADKLSIPIFIKTFETKKYAAEHKVSTQVAARNLRYHWFNELKDENLYDYILTGHHLDDDLETFFINLSRGTGIRGLDGIPSIINSIVRPLLNFSREEILQFAERKNLNWREDSSNASRDYLRNKLRLDVIPNYKEIDSRVLNNFKTTQKNLRMSQNLIDDYMTLIKNLVITQVNNEYHFNVNQLKSLPNTDGLLYELLFPFGFNAWNDISELLSAQTGKQIFSKTHRLIKNREVLILAEINLEEISEVVVKEGTEEIYFPFHLVFSKVNKIIETHENTVYLDRDKISFPLELRHWKEGDAFYPFGMKGKKKLSKLFKDEKLSLVAKEKIWLLCSENEIVWVVGMRLDDRFKTDDNTNEILKIALLEN